MRYIIILIVVILGFLAFRTVQRASHKLDNFLNDCIGVKGTGNVVEEERTVSPFSKLRTMRGVDVFLSKGEEPKVVVIIDENLQEYIVVENENEVLVIKSEENIRSSEKYEIYVTYSELGEIKSSSGSRVKTQETLETPTLDVISSSGSKVNIDVQAEKVSCDVSSGARVNISGKATDLWVDVSSGSKGDLSELQVESCEVKASSGGKAKVYVTGKLKAKASSGGTIHVEGNPTTFDVKKSSGGRVHKK